MCYQVVGNSNFIADAILETWMQFVCTVGAYNYVILFYVPFLY
jgi:hypothetical protein